MRKELFLPVAMFMLLLTNACKQDPTSQNNDSLDADSTIVPDSVAIEPDTTMWGHMGDGTTMNVVEFITEKGDTLYLCKEDMNTGKSAQMIGSLRNGTDLIAITAQVSADDESTISTCINATQMMGVWKNGKERIAFYADGSADNSAETLHNWKIANGELILALEQTTEYGTTQRNDTMRLVELTDNELVYTNRHGQTFTFTK